MGSAIVVHSPVKKLGSQWEGCVVAVAQDGALITNFKWADLTPFSTAAKLWFEVNTSPITVRGLGFSPERSSAGTPAAVEGQEGLIKIVVNDHRADQFFQATLGTPVTLHFRV